MLLHASLAVEAGTEALLGLVSMQVWNRGRGELAPRRKRTTANKESQRWIESTQQAGKVLAAAAGITMVSDRESDFYELFAERPQNVELIVRACQNRRIEGAEEDPHLLFSFIEAQAEQGRFVMTIPAAPGRRERKTEFAVRFAPVPVSSTDLNWSATGDGVSGPVTVNRLTVTIWPAMLVSLMLLEKAMVPLEV